MKYLQEKTKIPLGEMDDMLTKMNGGIYPKDGDYRHKVLYPRIVKEVLAQDHIVFFANTHIFLVKDLKQARKLGFIVIQLLLSREKMEIRNKKRMEDGDWNDISLYFKYMLEYQEEIRNKGVVDKEINADQSIEIIAKDVIKTINSRHEN